MPENAAGIQPAPMRRSRCIVKYLGETQWRGRMSCPDRWPVHRTLWFFRAFPWRCFPEVFGWGEASGLGLVRQYQAVLSVRTSIVVPALSRDYVKLDHARCAPSPACGGGGGGGGSRGSRICGGSPHPPSLREGTLPRTREREEITPTL